ncbi:aminotransferase class III-fold pyridoxal phosphate-dependent enzyme, partial [Pseudooceanicola sp. CBS1P-1]
MTHNKPLAEAARRHLLDPAASLKTLGQKALPRLDRAEGIYVVDENGHRLIDGPAGMWCTQVGYNRREIADAMAGQAMNLSYTSPWYMGNSPAIRLAETIARLTPGDLNRVFFTTGGSTAVDTALRFVEFRNNVRGLKDKKGIIVQVDGY